MSNNNGKITAPIDLRNDAYAVTGAPHTDKGYSLVGLCKNPQNINMWSLKKPVDSDALFPVSGGVPNWWLGSKKDCNLDIEIGSDKVAIYRYRTPQRCNLAMFAGYNHNVRTGLAFKREYYECNIFEDSPSVMIDLEDDEEAVKLVDMMYCDAFKNYHSRLLVRPIGDTIIANRTFSDFLWGKTFLLDTNALKSLGVGDFQCRFALVDDDGRIACLPFPAGATQNCRLKLFVDTGIVYSWDAQRRVYDPEKRGFEPLINYDRFGSPLNIKAEYDVKGFLLYGAYLTLSGDSVLTSLTSDELCIAFEYLTDLGHYVVYSRVQLYDDKNNVFNDFPKINKGGGVVGLFGCDYRYLPNFQTTTTCQFYFVYLRYEKDVARYYQVSEKHWLKLNCPIGRGIAQKIG